MKKILLGTVGLVALGMAAPASAADLAARPYTKAPPPMMAAIVRLERLLPRSQRRLGLEPQVLGRHRRRGVCRSLPLAEGCHNATGGMAGGQIGYRWQARLLGVRCGSAGRLGRSERLECRACSSPGAVNQTRIDALRPVHRPGRLRLEQRPALRQGRRRRRRRQVQWHLTSATGVRVRPARTETRWGGTVGAGVEVQLRAELVGRASNTTIVHGHQFCQLHRNRYDRGAVLH